MSENELSALQQAFVAAVLGEASRDLLDQLEPILPLTPAEALEVYRRDYAARLAEALSERFPAIGFVLGTESSSLWRDYLALERSSHYDLGRFGETLPDFLAGHSLLQKHPFLSELARLELAFDALIHAAVEAPGELSLLEDLADPGGLVLTLVAPLKLFVCDWPLRDLWNLRHSQAEPVLPQPAPQALLLFKNAAGIRTSLLSPIQASLLQALTQGLSLSAALDSLPPSLLADAAAHPAQDVAGLFALLRREELILRLENQPRG